MLDPDRQVVGDALGAGVVTGGGQLLRKSQLRKIGSDLASWFGPLSAHHHRLDQVPRVARHAG